MIPSLERLKDTKRKLIKYKVINMTEELYHKVDQVCEEIHCTKSAFAKLAIEKLIAEYEKGSAE